MPTLNEAAESFLNLKTIAVTGVSSTKKNPANYILAKLRQSGKEVYAINPKVNEIDGQVCYSHLSTVPVKIDGVVIGTHPSVTLDTVKSCAELGIKHVWIHKSVDNGSYNAEAEQFCRDNGINIIPAGCPLMHCQPVDFPHKCLKWVLGITRVLPQNV
ncbi:MAG: CoA-binding protein [Cyclobacteriaceae bacterium]|nr:CoA-binding protein [Cyclobacteriaceae bacterium]